MYSSFLFWKNSDEWRILLGYHLSWESDIYNEMLSVLHLARRHLCIQLR